MDRELKKTKEYIEKHKNEPLVKAIMIKCGMCTQKWSKAKLKLFRDIRKEYLKNYKKRGNVNV